MPEPEGDLKRLDPRIQWIWVLYDLVGAFVLAGLALAGEAWLRKKSWWPLPLGTVSGFLLVAGVLSALILPWFRYRAWRFALRTHDVLLCYGVVWKTRRSVPRRRIQHLDVTSGPLERARGLATIILYTAGGNEADARIPGLAAADAEALRDALLASDATNV